MRAAAIGDVVEFTGADVHQVPGRSRAQRHTTGPVARPICIGRSRP
jgi:hypothetical protein